MKSRWKYRQDTTKRKQQVAQIPTIDIFTQRLTQAIEDEGIVQAQMTEDGVVCFPALSRYKAGYCYPSMPTLLAMCEYLNVSADWLLGLTNEKRTLW